MITKYFSIYLFTYFKDRARKKREGVERERSGSSTYSLLQWSSRAKHGAGHAATRDSTLVPNVGGKNKLNEKIMFTAIFLKNHPEKMSYTITKILWRKILLTTTFRNSLRLIHI